LISRTSEEIYKALKEAAPFLARIYAILKQSAINLNCLSSKKGENYLNYIRKVKYKNN
jgi:DNA-binding phage protein